MKRFMNLEGRLGRVLITALDSPSNAPSTEPSVSPSVSPSALQLSGLYFVGQKYFPHARQGWIEAPHCPLLREAARQYLEYEAGTRELFDLPLAPQGTPFQRAVWQALCEVPFGRTATYGELAARVGHPGSARAVGAAVGRNPISVIIPCHRILGADGGLTGYAGGLERKQQLLQLEGVLLA